MNIDPTQSAVLVIDMQFDFFGAGGKAEQAGEQVSLMQALPDKINPFVSEMREKGAIIIFTKFIDDNDKSPGNYKELVGADKTGDWWCKANTPGAELHGVIIESADELLEKYTYDCFSNARLNQILKKQNIKNIVIIGVRTEVCVNATANRSFTEGYRTFVISDLVETYDKYQNLSKGILESLSYASYVWSSDKFLSKLFKKPA